MSDQAIRSLALAIQENPDEIKGTNDLNESFNKTVEGYTNQYIEDDEFIIYVLIIISSLTFLALVFYCSRYIIKKYFK